MDGKGAWRDNVFVERFWRAIKYEEVYLRAYDDPGPDAKFGDRHHARRLVIDGRATIVANAGLVDQNLQRRILDNSLCNGPHQ